MISTEKPTMQSRIADSETPVLLSREGQVLHLRLNRPQARNALSEALRNELITALEAAQADDEVRSVLITAEGKSFCAGADIHELSDRSPLAAAWPGRRLDTAVENVSKPIVAAMQGHVLGGGLELALCFTVRIAASDLKAGLPEVKLGVFPGMGGTQRLPRIVGEGRALEILLTGRMMGAQEALHIGLISEVIEPDQLLPRGMALAQQLANGPPIAMRVIIEAARRASDLGRAEGLDYERRLLGLVCSTEDKLEGTRAWKEKRRPRFKGR